MAPAIPVTFTDVLIVASSIYFLHKVFRKVTSRSGVPITPLRGPPSPNWLFGVHRDIVRAKDPGAVWENWQREYGLVYATPAPLGQTRIALFDSKALAHFYARETWTYVNPRISKMIIENMVREYVEGRGSSVEMAGIIGGAIGANGVVRLTSSPYDWLVRSGHLGGGGREP